MRTIRDASEDEVVAAFLQAEIDSDRHAQKILTELHADGRPKSIVDSPDFEDHEGNAYRRAPGTEGVDVPRRRASQLACAQ